MSVEDAIGVSSVKCWVHCFKGGAKDVGDRPFSGQPATAATSGIVKESFLWSSWRSMPQSIQSDMCSY
jgi:hypothetical protein